MAGLLLATGVELSPKAYARVRSGRPFNILLLPPLGRQDYSSRAVRGVPQGTDVHGPDGSVAGALAWMEIGQRHAYGLSRLEAARRGHHAHTWGLIRVFTGKFELCKGENNKNGLFLSSPFLSMQVHHLGDPSR